MIGIWIAWLWLEFSSLLHVHCDWILLVQLMFPPAPKFPTDHINERPEWLGSIGGNGGWRDLSDTTTSSPDACFPKLLRRDLGAKSMRLAVSRQPSQTQFFHMLRYSLWSFGKEARHDVYASWLTSITYGHWSNDLVCLRTHRTKVNWN